MASPYQVGVDLSISTNGPQVLGNLAQHLLGLQGGVTRLTQGFATLRLGIIGAAMAITGRGLFSALEGVAEHSEKLLNQQDKLMRGGIAYNDVLRIQADYYDRVSKQIPTSTAAEYLSTINELRAVTGSLEGAVGATPKAMKVDELLSNTFGKQMHGEYYKLLRSAEMKGIATDPTKREDLIDKAFSYITAFGGKLTANDFQLIARRGGTAWMNTDMDKALGAIAVMAADLGGSQAGTTLMTLQQLQMGSMTFSKQQAKVFEDLGLLDMSKTEKTGFGGGKLQLQPGALKGSLAHTGDLPGWIQDVIYPALQAASHGDDALLDNLLSKIAPNRNAAKLIKMFGDKGFLDQISKDLGLAGQVLPIDQAYDAYTSRNPKGVQKAYNEQWESMMQAMGLPLMQAAIPVMKGLTDMFNNLGSWANSHPELIKNIGIAVAGLSATLTALGVVLIGGAVGAAVGTTGGIVAAVGVLATAFVALRDPLEKFVGLILDLPSRIMRNLPSLNPFGPTSYAPVPSQSGATPIRFESTINLDGRVLARAVTEHQARASTFQTSVGSQDTRSTWLSPGAMVAA